MLPSEGSYNIGFDQQAPYYRLLCIPIRGLCLAYSHIIGGNAYHPQRYTLSDCFSDNVSPKISLTSLKLTGSPLT